MSARRGPAAGFILINTGFLWLSMIVAAFSLWPIYRSPALIVLVGVALAAGTLVAILGAVLRWSAAVTVLAAMAVFLLIGVPLAVPAKAWFIVLPSPGGLIDLLAGVALGWKQLLTISLPVGDYEALLVPALVLVFGAAVTGLTVALRAPRGEPAVLAPFLVFVTAIAFGPRLSDRPVITAILLLAAVLAWLVWFRHYRRARALRLLVGYAASGEPGQLRDSSFAGARTVASAALIMTLAAAGGVAVAQAIPPEADRSVLRSAVEQPFDPRDYVSPLAGFRRHLQPAAAESVLFEVTGLPAGARIRLATLDTYDGVVYSVGSSLVASESGSFTRVPSAFDQSAVSGERVSIEVTIGAYEGVWVPTVGKFESVRFQDSATRLRESFYYNDVSGTAAVIQPLGRGDSYTLTAVLPAQPEPSELDALQPGTAVVPKPAAVPEELTAKLAQYTDRVAGAGARLAAALEGLAAEGYISHGVDADEPPSRSGHAADRVAELLSAPRMIGDAEQYAVAAALMAHELGFPSRVVMGFSPSGEQVRGADVAAWIEINTASFGWVAIDPTPPEREIPEELPEDNAQVARPQTIVPPTELEHEDIERQTTPERQQELPPDLDPLLQALLAGLRVAGGVLLVLAIALAPFAVIVAAKLRRRWLRRKAASAIERIHGGWQEFEDAVLDHGLSPAPAATRTEVAAITGGERALVLASVADRATFAPGQPDDEDAERVWRSVDELRASLDEPLTRWQRLKVRVSVRSLGGYSVSRLFKR